MACARRRSSSSARVRNRLPAASRGRQAAARCWRRDRPGRRAGCSSRHSPSRPATGGSPSSIRLAAKRSLWPKTRSIGPTATFEPFGTGEQARQLAHEAVADVGEARRRSRAGRGTPRRPGSARAGGAAGRGGRGAAAAGCAPGWAARARPRARRSGPSTRSSTSTPGSACSTAGEMPAAWAARLAASSCQRRMWWTGMSSPMRTKQRRCPSSTRKLALVIPPPTGSGTTGRPQIASDAAFSRASMLSRSPVLS